MMMKRCQVFAAPRRQEKGWLLYLRSLPQGMTNNSARPLFPKLSRYKQIVIVKLLNFGRFASFISEQKSRHQQQKGFILTVKLRRRVLDIEILRNLCDCSYTPKKRAEGTQKDEAWTFLFDRRLTSLGDAGCVWHGMCICVLSDRPAV